MPSWPSERAPAPGGDEQAFRELIDPYRGKLQPHCYRMLGSVPDAEDLLQETRLAARRGLERFDGDPRGRSGFARERRTGLASCARRSS